MRRLFGLSLPTCKLSRQGTLVEDLRPASYASQSLWTSAHWPLLFHLLFHLLSCSACVRHASSKRQTLCQRCRHAAAQADVASAVGRAAGGLDQPSAVLTSVAAISGSSYNITVIFPPAERVDSVFACAPAAAHGVWPHASLGLVCGREHGMSCEGVPVPKTQPSPSSVGDGCGAAAQGGYPTLSVVQLDGHTFKGTPVPTNPKVTAAGRRRAGRLPDAECCAAGWTYL